MRRRNWRVVSGGVVLIAMALGFYFVMLMFAPQSTDPVEMMKVAGQVSGAMIGISLVMIVLGLIGKKSGVLIFENQVGCCCMQSYGACMVALYSAHKSNPQNFQKI